MINYNSATALRSFLDEENLGMRKKFGQNFLINPQVRLSLVSALDAQVSDEVWEVGPGLGAMTALLLEKGLAVKAFEIDAGFIRILKRIFSQEKNFSLVEGDVMKTWSGQQSAPFLLGNLPYNVGAALLADLIEKGRTFSRIVVTVQKEVALRMSASAGSPDYSSFSVLCASAYKVKPLMVIRPSSFYPQPNVDSMGVLLEKRDEDAPPAVFFQLVRALFSSRRKTIKNNLSAFCASRFGSTAFCADILRENALTGMERAEDFPLEVFLSLAKTIENMRILNRDVNSGKHSKN
ncbi:MAG: 16S rRNA (adenine(1518)-N(6)/adenine(1519)-N(6))-dimethyltransferase RsmA [Treponema sp.]|jgi:16S rRNA (adenine1518-N6/adenine1519-N6)-dimethyltransferase|nr:16S rRNA (adenine(1518)-N(6)/adenine(1519)-N(6))-dimethyltransferase RsmA [Treponema sp.]